MHLLWLIKINHSNNHKTCYEKYKLVTFPNGVFFVIVNTKYLRITVDKPHSCILKLPNLPKSVEYHVYLAGKKRKDEHDKIKEHLHPKWTIVSFKWFVINFLAVPMENFYSRVKVKTMYFLCRWVARQLQYSSSVFLKTLMISLYSK